MKYKVNDHVRIKSIDWYNKNKDEYGSVNCHSYTFSAIMSNYCGTIRTINSVDNFNKKYKTTEDGCHFDWTDEMIEGLVEEEMPLDKAGQITDFEYDGLTYSLPDGYIFKDENGNIINATKIVLEKKKKEYPKTFLGCCDVLNIGNLIERGVNGYKAELFDTLQKLYICRDAYWKLYGEEMGLGKPWEPNWNDDNAKYSIYTIKGVLMKAISCYDGAIFTFPTEELRDAFYENFKELIEQCKELL